MSPFRIPLSEGDKEARGEEEEDEWTNREGDENDEEEDGVLDNADFAASLSSSHGLLANAFMSSLAGVGGLLEALLPTLRSVTPPGLAGGLALARSEFLTCGAEG